MVSKSSLLRLGVAGSAVYFLLVKLQNSDSTLGIIDSLEEAVSAAGKFYLQLYRQEEKQAGGE